ncbi:hypothetical protein [Dysgonomonas macrotermitis]|uniref:BetR domain-containing protein n=1 Tax=Dysgonomonas macrotermitis TaxID=1346286 RepID=A0A1M5D544_9BACT|nr:hypothetical protein [Dysgonomonas macrotermitis]SHF62091.1 hypothetical protein SAMN05444362_10879 [Dysgonomonas macrotermitis]
MKESNKLHERLISTIKKSMSDGDILVNELMDALCIGKEAVYRRLRGEVAFTFDEIAALSRKFGFSLDSVVGVESQAEAIFDLRIFDPDFQIEDYCHKMIEYTNIFRKLSMSSYSVLRMALNALPFPALLPYHNLTKLRLYRWIYQSQKSLYYKSFSEFEIPDKILDIHKLYIKEMRQIQRIVIVMDHSVFLSFIKEISYFYKLNLFTQDEFDEIKSELLAFVNDLEETSLSGRYNGVNDVQIYISDISLDSSYVHYECNEFEVALLRLYSMNTIESQNEEICRVQKEWIESLKRYSTLITQSGERQRHSYFTKQREAVRSLPSLIS